MKRKPLTERELRVMSSLWAGGQDLTLGRVVDALKPETKWSRNTVLTYLTRMERKGLVSIDKAASPHRYRAAFTQEDYALQEQKHLMDYLSGDFSIGAMACFLKGSRITAEERDELRKLLDDMDV